MCEAVSTLSELTIWCMSEETSGLLEISERNVNTGTSSPPDFCGGAGRHDPCSQRTNNLPQLRRSPAHDSAIMHTCIDVQHYRQHASDDRSNITQLVQGSTVNVLYRKNVRTRLAPLYCMKRNSLSINSQCTNCSFKRRTASGIAVSGKSQIPLRSWLRTCSELVRS